MWAILLTLSIISVDVSGFAIRAPRLARDVTGIDENSLSDALRVLEREKRRLENEASFRDWEPGYYDNWNDDDDSAIDDDVDDVGEDFDLEADDGEVSNDIAGYLASILRQEDSERPYERQPDLAELEEDALREAEAEKEELKPNRFDSERVSIDELKEIFNDDTEPEADKKISLKSKKSAARRKKTPEVENSLLGDRERMSESLKADKNKNKAAKQKKNIPRSKIDLKHLSRSQIQELLNEVDKIEKQEVLENANSGKGKSLELDEIEESTEESEPDLAPVSEEELKDVLGDVDDDEEEEEADLETDDAVDEDGEEETEQIAESDEVVPGADDINRGSLSREMYGRTEDRKKRLAKRDNRRVSPVNRRSHYSAEISRLLEIIGKLRLKNLLENKEIDSLADALDVATNTQAQQSLGQLPKELKSLQRAIKIEESMQEENSELSPDDEQYLRDVIEELVSRGDADDTDDEEYDDTEEGQAFDVTEKRGGNEDEDEVDDTAPTFADRMGQWYEEPIDNRQPMYEESDDDNEIPDDEISDDDVTDENLVNKLEEEAVENEEANEILENLIDRYRAEEELASEPEAEEDNDGEEDAEVAELYPVADAVDEEEERSPSSSYQDALARLFRDEQVNEATQREIEQALAQFQHNVEPWQRRELENRIRDYEQCSALDNIVSDCRLADELNIPIDDEARELCSRHEACYTCGGVLGKAADQCDAGYLAEAFQLCNGAEKCNLKADAFLRLLQYYHRYSASSSTACEHQCVVDYIYGVAL